MIDTSAKRFGLPPCLAVPIAARSVADIEKHVGRVVDRIGETPARTNALLVAPHDYPPKKSVNVGLWGHADAARFEQRLHPPRQVWVHVDYTGYRRAYIRMNMPPIPPGYFLDHVQNRVAMRLRDYSHPYLRLCPVSRAVNASGGVNAGGEGMEKDYLRSLKSRPAAVQAAVKQSMQSAIVYADPMDLTKMLDIPPGTQVLNGVRDTQKLFYPA